MTYSIGPSFKEIQKQTLYGTVLGGSTVIKPEHGVNCYLTMRDSNLLWLQYKIDILRDFFKPGSDTIKSDKNTNRCYSISYPAFNDVYDLFYEDDKKIVRKELLDILTDEAWMVWFIDAGKKTSKTVNLRTQKFGEAGTQTIVDYFNSLDCECEMRVQKKRYDVLFTNKGAHEFLKILSPKIPNFLLGQFD